MPVSFHIDPRQEYLRFEVSGAFSFSEAKESFRLFFDEARQHSLSKILIDSRKMEGSARDFERYQLGESMAAEQGGPFRLAILRKVQEITSNLF